MSTGPHFRIGGFAKALGNLRARRVDQYEKRATLNEVYDSDKLRDEGTAVKYAVGAMQPIDPDYTKNTYREGDRVKNQLEKAGLACSFEYQGSVTSDTHIKARSDIDLLTLTCRFITVDRPGPVSSPYRGNSLSDLLELRQNSISTLRKAFPEATVDTSGSKAVAIEGGSLRRKVDVVSSSWRDTIEYDRTRLKRDRGVDVLDSKTPETLFNLPFLHNDRIETKDRRTGGGLRKAVRLLKSLKYDSSSGVDLSSYDIAAIAFRMDDDKLLVYRGSDLLLVERCKQHLDYLASNQAYREGLNVPNDTRKIFCSAGATKKGLDQLRSEVDQLLYEIVNEMSRSFRKLAAARIEY
ncbi:MAG: hypothetical protein JSS49_30340 [Planctomycetes bacterium]|nr:hypothetical protein [Planctomycetota bacterium]